MKNVTTLTVNVGMYVDKSTAEMCLKLVQIYVNNTGINVIAKKADNGELIFNFIEED